MLVELFGHCSFEKKIGCLNYKKERIFIQRNAVHALPISLEIKAALLTVILVQQKGLIKSSRMIKERALYPDDTELKLKSIVRH